MRLTICGSRGSTPAPGEEFDRYGGHTSCVAVAHDEQAPTLVLDAGTGLRGVSRLLDGRPYEGAVLLGHLHWDHTQGLPFFAGGDRPGSRVDVYVPAQGDSEEVLARFMSPPHFPITPSELRGAWTFQALDPGRHRIEGFDVLALDIPHKGGRTFGFRISDGKATLAYLSDHRPTSIGSGPDGRGERHPAALELVRGCDLMIHDAQYTDQELPEKESFGHSSAGYAVGLAAEAGAQRVMLFHHDPSRTDGQMDAIVTRWARGPVQVTGAAQGMVVDLPG
jgi:phosphoribosyl 1,2-cyclic phosphodiesterase